MSFSGTVVEATTAPQADIQVPEGEGARKIEGRSTWQLAWARLKRDRAAIISAIVILLIFLMAIFAPLFATVTGHGVNQQFRITGLSPDGIPVGPGKTFWWGTDDQGRDILVRVAYGARVSLFVGVVATLLTVIIGAVLGLAAGFLGGIMDTIIARLIDLVLSLPYLLFAIALVSISKPSIQIVIIVIALFGWAAVARIVRGQVLSIREKEYVEAARSLGSGTWRIMFIDILPNVTAQLIVYATLLIPVSIVAEASLSFLGLGVPPPTADWGQMLAEAQTLVVNGQAWWFMLFPGAALVITTLAFNILGDGVRDALDPRFERL
jgi:ABC-type dipeptide/oligopeptide/nickel transport system permease subunit